VASGAVAGGQWQCDVAQHGKGQGRLPSGLGPVFAISLIFSNRFKLIRLKICLLLLKNFQIKFGRVGN
jgi:hypothetical protein